MKEIRIQECLENFRNEISALIAKEDTQWLLSYFKLPDDSLLSLWLSGEKPIKGLRLIKMVFYLYERHFLKIDFSKDEEAIVRIIKILALDTATPREAADNVGYKEESDLYRVLLGKVNYSRISLSAMKIFAERYSTATSTDEVETTRQTLTAALSPISCTNQEQLTIDLIHTIGSISTCLEPLLKKLVESSPNERQAFRNSLGKDERGIFQISNVFFRVSDLVNALCSEKSVQTYKNNRRKK